MTSVYPMLSGQRLLTHCSGQWRSTRCGKRRKILNKAIGPIVEEQGRRRELKRMLEWMLNRENINPHKITVHKKTTEFFFFLIIVVCTFIITQQSLGTNLVDYHCKTFRNNSMSWDLVIPPSVTSPRKANCHNNNERYYPGNSKNQIKQSSNSNRILVLPTKFPLCKLNLPCHSMLTSNEKGTKPP